MSFPLSSGVYICFYSLTVLLLGFQEGEETNAICISFVNYLSCPLYNFLLGISCFEFVKILYMKDINSDIWCNSLFCVNLLLKHLLEGAGGDLSFR